MMYRSPRPKSLQPRPSCQRIVLAVVACAALSASFALAKFGVIKTRDGGTFEGDITERDSMVVVKDKRGIETRIRREDVANIEYREDPELEYNRRHRELAPSEVEGRVALARFALAQRRPDLAREVLLEALALNPNDRDASALYDVAKGQIELDRKAASRDPGRDATPARTPAATTVPEEGAEAARKLPELLTPDEINHSRQVEVRQGETGMTFRFDNDVERRFAQKFMTSPGTIKSLTPFERFTMMRDRQQWGLLRDVRLMRDPQAIADFRRQIHPQLLSGCAQAGCHGSGGGLQPGVDWPFQLRTQGDSEARDYTNFFILATSRFPVKLANGQTLIMPMIDRIAPERSLLLQYALPAPLAQFPHPPSRYKRLVASTDDPKYRMMLSWIRDELTPEDRGYGFALGSRPGQGSTTGPSGDNGGATSLPASGAEGAGGSGAAGNGAGAPAPAELAPPGYVPPAAIKPAPENRAPGQLEAGTAPRLP